ncbi:unnamed protein product [Urochloa humidicola]
MEEEEARLRFTLIAWVGNASVGFSTTEVSVVVAVAAGLPGESFTVVLGFPECFLIICGSQAARDRVLEANPLPMAMTSLSVRP